MDVTIEQKIRDLQPWYHDFSALGLATRTVESSRSPLQNLFQNLNLLAQGLRQRGLGNYVEKRDVLSLRRLFRKNPDSHWVNQRHKEAILVPMLTNTLSKIGSEPRCLDLFCADGYYTCWMKKRSPDAHVTSIDLDARHLERAQFAVDALGLNHGVEFKREDVLNFVQQAPAFDLIFCTGGLYHLENPQQFLRNLGRTNSKFLIVQSVVTLTTEDENFFVTPAPGWKHGSRFTHAALRKWLIESGWHIEQEARNTLTGNPRLLDRGSSYFLCRNSQ
ncbi:MAG: class I SAM-dependent methyltransferase [Chloroflexi bacterium]|nr:MAG: class I SAM-dependent methyltransferase [Chloroflexota bacterium]